MHKFSLKNIYDNHIGSYLLILDLLKWLGISLIMLSLFLGFYFEGHWLALSAALLLGVGGFILAIVNHFIKRKLSLLIDKGRNIAGKTEDYLKNRAKLQLKKTLTKKTTCNKSL